jgi:hypothetical protein
MAIIAVRPAIVRVTFLMITDFPRIMAPSFGTLAGMVDWSLDGRKNTTSHNPITLDQEPLANQGP